MKNIFEFTDYKEFLKELIVDKNAPRGYQSSLATAAGCQPAYLSQVLSGKPQLSEDNGIRISQFLKMTPLQTEYFLNLIRLGRSNDESFRKFIMEKIGRDQREQLNISQNIESGDAMKPGFISSYTSDALVSLIHIMSFSENFRTLPQICARLDISESRALKVLKILESLDVIKIHDGVLTPQLQSTHVPTDSEFNRHFQIQRRLLAINSIQKCDLNQNIHYSSAFTVSEEDFQFLKSQIVSLISVLHKRIEASPSDDVYSICMDAFLVPK